MWFYSIGENDIGAPKKRNKILRYNIAMLDFYLLLLLKVKMRKRYVIFEFLLSPLKAKMGDIYCCTPITIENRDSNTERNETIQKTENKVKGLKSNKNCYCKIGRAIKKIKVQYTTAISLTWVIFSAPKIILGPPITFSSTTVDLNNIMYITILYVKSDPKIFCLQYSKK